MWSNGCRVCSRNLREEISARRNYGAAMTTSNEAGFHVAPFGVDGEPVGAGFWSSSNLSNEWLRLGSEFLQTHGPVFDSSWDGPLSQIRTKFTSSSGAALATFFVNTKIASSLLLLSGQSPAAEQVVTDMFVDSIKRTVEQMVVGAPNHFSKIASIKERPLMVVVPWPEADISDQDYDLVRELGLHLAGAFFSHRR
jgi:hypothetical protein